MISEHINSKGTLTVRFWIGMVALALFYQTRNTLALLLQPRKCFDHWTRDITLHSMFTFFHIVSYVVKDEIKLFGSRNYMALFARWSDGTSNFHTSRLLSAFVAFATVSFFYRFLVIKAARIQLARIVRSIVACVLRRKSLVPSQISDHVF